MTTIRVRQQPSCVSYFHWLAKDGKADNYNRLKDNSGGVMATFHITDNEADRWPIIQEAMKVYIIYRPRKRRGKK